jgi:predicted Zn-dependent peptidase
MLGTRSNHRRRLPSLIGVVVAWSAVCGDLTAESIDRVVLPSGLVVVVAEQHTTPAVEVRIAVRAGPVHEGERLGSGLSLVTQRVLAGAGAADQSALQVREALARLGAQSPGTTGITRSEFSFTTTATGLGQALALWAKRLATPVVVPEDLERERGALALLEPSLEHSAMSALLFRQHPARLPLAGLPPLRAALTLEQVQAYHQERYRSANTVVLVCGNVAATEARRQIEQAFASYPLGGYAPQPLPIEPPPLAARYQALTSPTVKQPRIIIAWRTETLDHAAQPGLAVLATWLGGERGPLAMALSAKGLGHDLVVDHVTTGAVPGHLRLSFTTSTERRAEAEQTLYQTLEAIGQKAPDDAQLAAARSTTLRRLAERQSTLRGLCDELLAWELVAGDPAYLRKYTEQIGDVDGVEIMRVLRRYVLSREGERGRCTLVVRPVDAKATRPLEGVKTPTPVSVVAPEIITLPRGARLVLRPSLEQPLARVQIVLGGGAAVEDRLALGATALLAPLMCRATETRTPNDIDGLLTARGMKLTTHADLHRLALETSCFPTDVPLALDLLVDCVSKAALPPDELDLVRQRVVADVAVDGWEQRFLHDVREFVLAGHYAAVDPRSGKGGFAHLDRSLLLAHYRRLAVAGNVVVVVYGRFERTSVIDAARSLVLRSGLPEGPAVQPAGTVWGEHTASSLTVTTHEAPVAAVSLVWHGPSLAERARDEAALLVLGAALDARLARALAQAATGQPTRLETRGEAYDKRGLWMVWGSCDESRVEQVQQAARDEVARFIAQLWLPEADRGALPEGDLQAAKANSAVRWALEQEDLGRVALRHATHVLLQQDVALDLGMPERLAAVTRKDLLRVAQTWLAGDPVTVIAKPKPMVAPPSAAAPAPTPIPVGGAPAVTTPAGGAAPGPMPVAPLPAALPPAAPPAGPGAPRTP